MSQPWYREVSRQQWKTFLTTFAAWTLDAFDFTILTFVLIDIQQSFTVNKALAGALGTVMLVYLYPVRLTPSRLVGTDLAHAIPLTIIAGTGHLMMGNVNPTLLGNLLLGSIPGVLLGSWVSTRAPMQWVRVGLAAILAVVAVKMLTT